MTYSAANLAEVIIAAKGANADIATAVGENPVIVDVDTPFSRAVKTTGLLQMPLALPHNPDYHHAVGVKSKALEEKSSWHIEVIESVHISHSCVDPHLTIYVKKNDGTPVGPKRHICMTANGKSWQFDKIG